MFLAKVIPLSWEKEGEFWFDRDSSNIDKANYFEMETLNNEVQTEYASATEKIQIIFRIGETSKSVDNGIRLSVDDIIN